MRIISGTARGTKLETLKGSNTRPTLDRVKESVFNIISQSIEGCTFLDLFAGSGAIGLEAGSRGAKEVFMCEKSNDAIEVIEKNIKKTHLEKLVKLYKTDFKNMLLTKLNKKVDIVYVDPPYIENFATQAVKILLEKELLKDDSIIIVETDREEIIEQFENIKVKVIDKRKYGRVHIIFLAKT